MDGSELLVVVTGADGATGACWMSECHVSVVYPRGRTSVSRSEDDLP